LSHAERLLSRPQGRPLGQPAALPRLITVEAPGWLAAMSERRLDRLADVMTELATVDADEEAMVVCGNVAGPAIAADWAGWLLQMQRLEDELFAPLLAALGQVKQLRLVLSHRDGHLETTTTPMAQRKFWRRPTLEALG
jgi:hypothetical protein